MNQPINRPLSQAERIDMLRAAFEYGVAYAAIALAFSIVGALTFGLVGILCARVIEHTTFLAIEAVQERGLHFELSIGPAPVMGGA